MPEYARVVDAVVAELFTPPDGVAITDWSAERLLSPVFYIITPYQVGETITRY